ncbi:Mrp/NBP35 family ATP-binding protein [Tissierella carlieri]|uniref:Iron-sulfur cluster carrier protein n=1 Tax=Tissierella carlieri TaxID=689904 RepID=A0ABT1SCS8_9FIRM|nr:Mrp/NBP35 family ATP-binding protein [Tissierella carlieri]MCQ4924271.1 Mrp/NBP35 family ATP-binding protein [Tissierella carlieri]
MANCDNCPSKSSCSKPKDGCMIENNPLNKINKVIGVMSGKGGVGKSTVSVLIAKGLRKKGYKVGILDADITGPSIPRLLDIKDAEVESTENFLYPVETEDGIKVMSFNLLMEDENQPVIWRGPIISATVKQFWTDVLWDELDYLIIDMPPGTGDVALTVMDSIPINGLVMVSIPQDMVSMIVAKAVNMARKMNISIIGVIQNMSYVLCPNCNEKIKIYDTENINKFLEDMNLKLLGEIPMVKEISNISNNSYGESDKIIDKIFNPILENITKAIE